MFWPSGVKRSFGGFVGSMFIVGSGLSTLETSANPYIATCGPPRYSELRLNLSQSFQAIGSVVAPLLAAQVFFKNVNDTSLATVQYTYLAVACFVFLLAIVFYLVPIPEITDSDMADGEEQGRNYDTGYVDKPLYKQYVLFWGVAAQLCYVGSQVAIANFFINYVQQVDQRTFSYCHLHIKTANTYQVKPATTQSTASNLLAVAQSLFAIGRFASSFLMRFLRPRHVLWLFMTMIVVFIICAMTTPGNAGIATLSLVLFFESCVYPTIFTLALRGLGRHTKRGASFIVASVSGGAVFPPVLGAVADARNTQIAMCVPLAGFIVSWSFPFYLNLFKGKELDGYLKSKVGLVEGSNASVESGIGGAGVAEEDKKVGAVDFAPTKY